MKTFFFRDHHDFDKICSWFANLRQFFCPIRNVLENYDLWKRHKFWAKHHCPQSFLAGTPMEPINDIALKRNTICMLFE